jgi:Skp family chaperone for outer membrane proteins
LAALKLKQKLEDKSEVAKAIMNKKTQEGEKAIYIDIEAAVQALAKARGIDLVLSYNDIVDSEAKYKALVLQKRIAACGMPVYTGPGVDISDEIVRVLNYNYELNKDK